MIRVLNTIPIALFVTTIIFNLVFTLIELDHETYIKVFYPSNEFLSSPVVCNVYMLLGCFILKSRLHNILSVVGLLLLNASNYIFMYVSIDYSEYQLYSFYAVIVPLCFIALVAWMNSRVKIIKF